METLQVIRHADYGREGTFRQLGKALRTKETSISIPCYADRRCGGVADDESARGIEGEEALSKNGQRYLIPPYGAHMDPSEGMGKSCS